MTAHCLPPGAAAAYAAAMPKPRPYHVLLPTLIALLSGCGDPSTTATPVDPLFAVNPALADGVPVSATTTNQSQYQPQLTKGE